MLIAGTVAAVGVVSGLLAFALARRWPTGTVAPTIDSETIVEEVERHPQLESFLKRRVDPGSLAGLALTVAAGGVLLASVGIGALLVMARSNRGLARWDSAFARFGADHATDFSTPLLKSVSLIGGTGGVIVIGVVSAVIAMRHTRTRAVIAFMTLVVAGQFALSNLIKVIVGRARPDIRPLTGFSGTSFPSGHATAAAATLLGCALLLGRTRSNRQRAGIWAGAVALAAMVAATRVLLGVHWFTDVLAGLLLGWGWFALCSIAFGGRLLRFGQTVGVGEMVAQATADGRSPSAAGRR